MAGGEAWGGSDGGSGSGGGGSGGSGGGDSSGSNGGSDESASGYAGGCRRLASDASGEAAPCCVGWDVGMVWTVAIFATMLRLWLSDLGHRARFATTDRVHKLLDITGYMLVLLTASNVKAYHHKELRQMEDGSTNARFALFYLFLLAAVALWLLRYLEIAVFSHDQASRRYAASMFVDETGVLVCWTLAYLAGARTSTPSAGVDIDVLNRSVDVGVALLLILGAVWPELRAYWRVKRMALFPGDWLPAQLTRVPFNVEFAIHRFAEFMMLMVGETVLQLVLAEPNATDRDVSALEAQVVHVLTLISGFAISVSMLYSFNIKEPHHARGHAYAHSSTNGIAFTLLYMLKACAVLLTGIGVKLAIYNPFSSPDEPSQRKQFAVSISVCFGLQLVMRPLHSGSLFKYYGLRKLLQAPKRALVIFLRVCTVGGMLALIAAPLSPALYVVAQALLALLENQLSSAEPKPLEEDDDAPHSVSPRKSRASGRFNSLMMQARSPRASRFSSRTSSFSGIVVERRKVSVLNKFNSLSTSCSRINAAASKLSTHKSPGKSSGRHKSPPPTPSAGPATGPPHVAKQKSRWPKPGDEMVGV